MGTLPCVNVGVDVSKKHLDTRCHETGFSIRLSNSTDGFQKFQELMSTQVINQVTCESTGGYEKPMVDVLRVSGYRVWRVNADRIKAFAKAQGIKAKTDKIDAKIIALFSAEMRQKYEPIQLSKSQEKLKALVATKQAIISSMTIIKVQLQQVKDVDCARYLKEKLKSEKKIVAQIDKQINTLIQNEEGFKNATKLIRSIPGLGSVTAESVLAMFPEAGSISNKQAAALVGVAPIIKQSGSYKGHAKIGGGRAALRRVFYMPALSAIRYNPIIKVFFEGLINSGKTFKVAIVAVMRKLVTYVNTLLRKGELWNPAI